jgi:hypothetical protein
MGVHGSADSVAMKDLGKPGAGEPHARFDERGLETEHGLGTAAPAVNAWTAPDLSATAPAPDSTPTSGGLLTWAANGVLWAMLI